MLPEQPSWSQGGHAPPPHLQGSHAHACLLSGTCSKLRQKRKTEAKARTCVWRLERLLGDNVCELCQCARGRRGNGRHWPGTVASTSRHLGRAKDYRVASRPLMRIASRELGPGSVQGSVNSEQKKCVVRDDTRLRMSPYKMAHRYLGVVSVS